MERHFTYLDLVGLKNENVQEFVTALTVGVVLLGVTSAAATIVRRKVVAGDTIPDERPSLTGILDLFVEGFVKFQDSILGRENRKYLPLTGTVFLFTFFCNIIGLVPGIPAATTSVWVTVGLALLIFISFNYYGIKENGAGAYFKHFLGPVPVLALLMFPIEVLGTFLRILTLNLRLYWNISADHKVLSVFTDLAPYGIPVIFYALGTFICLIQAVVPTILTMVYILLATQHSEEGEHAH